MGVIHYFCSHGTFQRSFNATFLSLIPKCAGASNVIFSDSSFSYHVQTSQQSWTQSSSHHQALELLLTLMVVYQPILVRRGRWGHPSKLAWSMDCGLDLAQNLGYNPIILEVNSMLIIDCLTICGTWPRILSVLICDCRNIMEQDQTTLRTCVKGTRATEPLGRI